MPMPAEVCPELAGQKPGASSRLRLVFDKDPFSPFSAGRALVVLFVRLSVLEITGWVGTLHPPSPQVRLVLLTIPQDILDIRSRNRRHGSKEGEGVSARALQSSNYDGQQYLGSHARIP